MTIRVVLAEDDHLVRAGIGMVVSAEPDIEVVGEAADGVGALLLVEELQPDVVVMDVRMPGLDGVEATRRITADHPAYPDVATRVLVLTTFAEDDVVYGALRAGAQGFLLKQSPADLPTAIRRVAAGDAWLDPAVAPRVLETMRRLADTTASPERLDGLTPREREVLALVADGLSNGEIGARLRISESTVKTHVARILMKTGSRDRAQAVVLAFRSGLVRP